MASIDFDHVVKKFGTQTIVADFDLEVPDGRFVVLVGGSGCGKSTTLRMLAGLETVTGGKIHIGDRDVTRLAPGDRDVAMVFQDYALYPHLTARENVELGLKLRKVARSEIERRVTWAAEILGLGSLLDRRPAAMSGGQRQRVAMARAIVREPKVFLFDEPLSNLDAKLRGQMRVEIGRLHRRLGTTTLYVTHDQVEAMTLAQTLVVLDGGRIQQVGAPIDVYREPANRFVAGFIGSPPMNFVDGTIDDGVFRSEVVRAPLPKARAAGKATLGVRPDDLSVASGDGDGGPTLRGKVLLSERLGGTTHLHVDIGEQTVVAVVPSDRDFAPDDVLSLAFDPARAHFFDEHGMAIR